MPSCCSKSKRSWRFTKSLIIMLQFDIFTNLIKHFKIQCACKKNLSIRLNVIAEPKYIGYFVSLVFFHILPWKHESRNQRWQSLLVSRFATRQHCGKEISFLPVLQIDVPWVRIPLISSSSSCYNNISLLNIKKQSEEKNEGEGKIDEKEKREARFSWVKIRKYRYVFQEFKWGKQAMTLFSGLYTYSHILLHCLILSHTTTVVSNNKKVSWEIS